MQELKQLKQIRVDQRLVPFVTSFLRDHHPNLNWEFGLVGPNIFSGSYHTVSIIHSFVKGWDAAVESYFGTPVPGSNLQSGVSHGA